MTRLLAGATLVFAGASMMAAQTPPLRRAAAVRPAQSFQPPSAFQKYCFECHGAAKQRGDVNIERLIQRSAQASVGEYWDDWNKVAEMLESGDMPPSDKAEIFPSDTERAAAVSWVRATLGAYESALAIWANWRACRCIRARVVWLGASVGPERSGSTIDAFGQPRCERRCSATALASPAGTAFPICLAISVLDPHHRKSGGKSWSNEAS